MRFIPKTNKPLNPVLLMSCVLALTLLLLGFVGWFTWRTEVEVRRGLVNDLRALELIKGIDGVSSLTSLVHQIIRTADYDEIADYDADAKFILDSLFELNSTVSNSTLKSLINEWISTHEELIEFELKAMAFARTGQQEAGLALLDQETYDDLIYRYVVLERQITEIAEAEYAQSRRNIQRRSYTILGIVAVVFTALLIAWVYTILTVSKILKERQGMIDEMKIMAERDSLTGLYNRHGLLLMAKKMWKNCQRANQHIALFFVDLDRLKPINDEFGHDTGDKAIQAAAEILTSCFRETDVVGRLGGDEFAALTPIKNPDEARILETRLQQEIAEFNSKNDLPFEVSMSFGIKVCLPDIFTLDQALSEADELMYEHKKNRKLLREA